MTQFSGEPISLSEVDNYTAETLPLIDQVSQDSDPQTVDELLMRNPDLEIFVANSVRETIASIRQHPAKPGTVLHTLLLADGLSAGAIAGRMHVDPRTEVSPMLERLVEAGIVGIDPESSESYKKYSIAGIALASMIVNQDL